MSGAAAYGRAAQSALSPGQASLILHERLCQEVVAAKAAYEAKRLDVMCRHQQKCMRVLLALQNDIKPKKGDVNGAILSGFYLHLFNKIMIILRNDDVPAGFDEIISLMRKFNNKLSTAARAAA
ncbi:MAG: flagellar protein FliS [Caulobacteraceae bacterium]